MSNDIKQNIIRLLETQSELVEVLKTILRAHDSDNNGAYMGEAKLCRYFAEMARATIARAEGS